MIFDSLEIFIAPFIVLRLNVHTMEGVNMKASASNKISYVVGPKGAPLTRSDLPYHNSMRWTTHRKAVVVLAVEGGLITLQEACHIYNISIDEYLVWRYRLEQFGLLGLRSSKEQHYRYARSIISTIQHAAQHNK